MKRVGRNKCLLFFGLCLGPSSIFAQTYQSVATIGEACYRSAKNSAAQTMIDQTFILSADHPKGFLSTAQLTAVIRDTHRDSTYAKSLRDLVDRTTQIYANQSIYNWMMFEKIFGNLKTGNELQNKIHPQTLSKEKIQNAFQNMVPVFDAESATIDNLNITDLEIEKTWANPEIEKLNKICRRRHTTYEILNRAYRNKAYQDYDLNPGLEKALFPNGQPDIVTYYGDINALIRKRMAEERDATAVEASFSRYAISQSSYGYLLNTKTNFRNYIGKWDVQQCVEQGQQLKTITSDAEKTIPGSISQVRAQYQSILQTLATIQEPQWAGENVMIKTSQEIQEILTKFIVENPTSIQQALRAKPNQTQALQVCETIQNIQKIEANLEDLAPLVAIGVTVASALVGPEVLTLINMAWLSSSVADVTQSYAMEKRINQAILAKQVPVVYGQELIQNLQNQRPLSYLNGAVAMAGTLTGLYGIKPLTKGDSQIKMLDEAMNVRGVTKGGPRQAPNTKSVSLGKTNAIVAPGQKITLAQKNAIETWLANPKLQTKISSQTEPVTPNKTSADLDLFNNDPWDGGVGVATKPVGPQRMIRDLLRGTGVAPARKQTHVQTSPNVTQPKSGFSNKNAIQSTLQNLNNKNSLELQSKQIATFTTEPGKGYLMLVPNQQESTLLKDGDPHTKSQANFKNPRKNDNVPGTLVRSVAFNVKTQNQEEKQFGDPISPEQEETLEAAKKFYKEEYLRNLFNRGVFLDPDISVKAEMERLQKLCKSSRQEERPDPRICAAVFKYFDRGNTQGILPTERSYTPNFDPYNNSEAIA